MAFFTKMSLGKQSFFEDDTDQGYLESLPKQEQLPQEDYAELPVDVYNTTGNIVVVAQIAGAKDEDVSISVKDDVLIITVDAHLPQDDDLIKTSLHTAELKWGRTSRPIILPQSVDIKRIKAKITKERILIVKVPKAGAEREHMIRIELE